MRLREKRLLLRLRLARHGRASLAVDLVDLAAQLHQLPKLIESRYSTTEACGGAACARGSAGGLRRLFLYDDVKPRITRKGYNDVLMERQPVKLFLSCRRHVIRQALP